MNDLNPPHEQGQLRRALPAGGGTHNFYGTVFKISTNGALTSLYSFTGGGDGANPSAGLVQGSDGNFYGTTYGVYLAGNVFKMSTNGTLASLYSFTGAIDGGYPECGLVQGSDGNLYGTASRGGWDNQGTVFRISTTGVLTNLHSFTGYDGAGPTWLAQGSDGNLYGTTTVAYGANGGYGTVFRISTNGVLTNLHVLNGDNEGGSPKAPLVQGSDGNLYGTTYAGGTNGYGYGTVFRISTNGAFSSLYSFTGGNDGEAPNGLVQGSDGDFYGTTSSGFVNFGTVFKISTNGALTTLHLFTGAIDGSQPYAGLVQGSDGNFYGTTYGGGMNSYGTVFRISTNGVLTSLYWFSGGHDGAQPQAGLVQGGDGNFYGTTHFGGTNGYGTVFKISTNGGADQFVFLHLGQ